MWPHPLIYAWSRDALPELSRCARDLGDVKSQKYWPSCLFEKKFAKPWHRPERDQSNQGHQKRADICWESWRLCFERQKQERNMVRGRMAEPGCVWAVEGPNVNGVQDMRRKPWERGQWPGLTVKIENTFRECLLTYSQHYSFFLCFLDVYGKPHWDLAKAKMRSLYKLKKHSFTDWSPWSIVDFCHLIFKNTCICMTA